MGRDNLPRVRPSPVCPVTAPFSSSCRTAHAPHLPRGFQGAQEARAADLGSLPCLSLRQSGTSQPRLLGNWKEMGCGGAEVLVSHNLVGLGLLWAWLRCGTSRCRWQKLIYISVLRPDPLLPARTDTDAEIPTQVKHSTNPSSYFHLLLSGGCFFSTRS